ncbi:MAG: Ig-like domain-containing protein [Steroidobacteraceae bacterium]
MSHHISWKAVRAAASLILLGFLGSLAGCGGSSGGGDATTLLPNNAPLKSLKSIEVTPSLSRAAVGTTQQFTATGLYTDNSTQDLPTQVTWASSADAVAMVSNAADSKGLASAADVGSTTVSATSGDVSGNTTLTVTDATLVSIEVTPADLSIADGTTQQFTATGLYTDNSTQDLTTQVTWASSADAVATVSNAADSKGLASAADVGSTTVSATSGDVTGGTTLTVVPWSSPLVDELVAALLDAVTGVGTGTSFADQVTGVQAYLAVSDIASACSALDLFKSHVSAQSGKKVDPALAAQLTADANAIKTAIPCP